MSEPEGAASVPGDSGANTEGANTEEAEKGRFSFRSQTRAAAPMAVVWPLIAEAARWQDWSWLTRTVLVREGTPVPDGVGAVRRFTFGPGGSQEEVVAFEPPHHLGYVAVSGLPVRYYRADVELTEADGATTVQWRGRFDPLVPGTGAVLRVVLRRMTAGFAKQVSTYAERLATGS